VVWCHPGTEPARQKAKERRAGGVFRVGPSPSPGGSDELAPALEQLDKKEPRRTPLRRGSWEVEWVLRPGEEIQLRGARARAGLRGADPLRQAGDELQRLAEGPSPTGHESHLALNSVEELPQVRRHISSREASGEERPQQPPPAAQMTNADDLNPASIVARGRPNLPGATRLEDVRVDHRASQRSGLRPVVAEALPHDPDDRPRVAFGDFGRRLAVVVDRHVLGVYIAPELRPSGREVSRRLEHLLGACVALFDDVDLRHLRRLELCARDDLSHLSAFERDSLRDVLADPLCCCSSGLLRLEHEHRAPVASVVRSSPVAGHETRRLRDTRHNRLPQFLLRILAVADRDFHEHCVHREPPLRTQGASSLNGAAQLNKNPS